MQSPSPPARTAAGYPVKLDDDQRLLHGLTCIRPSARSPLADRLKQTRLSIQLDKRLALLVDANPLHAGLSAVKMTPRQADGHGVTHAPPPRAGRPALRSMSMAHCRSDNLSRRCSEPTVTAMWSTSSGMSSMAMSTACDRPGVADPGQPESRGVLAWWGTVTVILRIGMDDLRKKVNGDVGLDLRAGAAGDERKESLESPAVHAHLCANRRTSGCTE